MPADQDALREALKRVATALKGAGVPFALAGSYALWAHGAPEGEHDVDFVVPETETERAAHVLAEAGLRVEPPPEDWLFKIVTDGVVVDVLHRISGEPATADQLRRAAEAEVLSVREQLDWESVAAQTADNDFAAAFLHLARRRGIAPAPAVSTAEVQGVHGRKLHGTT